MNLKDPKITAHQYNEYINNQDVQGLASLMPDDFIFVPISGNIEKGKESMTRGWKKFSKNILIIRIFLLE